MSWREWADELRQDPEQAVGDLLSGAADIGTFERAAPSEFLLAILPRDSRLLSRRPLGEPGSDAAGSEPGADLPELLDAGLAAWLCTRRAAARPPARKLGAYAAQVCEALQWPLYFTLPRTRAALHGERTRWLQWLSSLTLSAFRDPEYDYWQVLAVQQANDGLQAFWHAFVTEAGRPAPCATSTLACWPWPGCRCRRTTACATCGSRSRRSSTATRPARPWVPRPRRRWPSSCAV